MIHDPATQELLARREEEVLAEIGVNRHSVLTDIVETKARCLQARPVLDKQGRPLMVEGPDGELVAAYTFDAQGALRAAELLGKYLKLWTDRQELTGTGGGPIIVQTRPVENEL